MIIPNTFQAMILSLNSQFVAEIAFIPTLPPLMVKALMITSLAVILSPLSFVTIIVEFLFNPISLIDLFLNEYPAACCGWDGQETDLRKTAYLHLDD